MIVTFEEFRAEHLQDGFIPQAAQASALDLFADPAVLRELERSRLAFTGFLDGRPIGAAGVAPITPWRGYGWLVAARGLPKAAWFFITRETRSVLWRAHNAGFGRIEADIAAGWAPGARWAAMLGFRAEGMRYQLEPGRDYLGYYRLADFPFGERRSPAPAPLAEEAA